MQHANHWRKDPAEAEGLEHLLRKRPDPKRQDTLAVRFGMKTASVGPSWMRRFPGPMRYRRCLRRTKLQRGSYARKQRDNTYRAAL
jgi:hypothetical protein